MEDLISGDIDIQLNFYTNGGTFMRAVSFTSTSDNDRGVKVTQLDNGSVALAWTREVGTGAQVMKRSTTATDQPRSSGRPCWAM